MATISATDITTGNSRVIGKQWLAMNSGDVGAAISIAGYSDKTVQIDGTLGTDGGITLRGSNKQAPAVATPADWFNLTDAQGNVLSKTEAAGEVVLENPLWISPICTGVGANSALNVRLIGRE